MQKTLDDLIGECRDRNQSSLSDTELLANFAKNKIVENIYLHILDGVCGRNEQLKQQVAERIYPPQIPPPAEQQQIPVEDPNARWEDQGFEPWPAVVRNRNAA